MQRRYINKKNTQNPKKVYKTIFKQHKDNLEKSLQGSTAILLFLFFLLSCVLGSFGLLYIFLILGGGKAEPWLNIPNASQYFTWASIIASLSLWLGFLYYSKKGGLSFFTKLALAIVACFGNTAIFKFIVQYHIAYATLASDFTFFKIIKIIILYPAAEKLDFIRKTASEMNFDFPNEFVDNLVIVSYSLDDIRKKMEAFKAGVGKASETATQTTHSILSNYFSPEVMAAHGTQLELLTIGVGCLIGIGLLVLTYGMFKTYKAKTEVKPTETKANATVVAPTENSVVTPGQDPAVGQEYAGSIYYSVFGRIYNLIRFWVD